MKFSSEVQYGVPKPIYVGSTRQEFQSLKTVNDGPISYTKAKTTPLSTNTKSLNNLNKYHYKIRPYSTIRPYSASAIISTSYPKILSTLQSSDITKQYIKTSTDFQDSLFKGI